MFGPIRRGESRRESLVAVAPLYKHADGSAASGGEVGGPQEPSGGAAVGRFIEATPHRVPSHRPTFHSQVGEPAVEVVMECGGVEPRSACTEADRLQVVASDSGNFLLSASRAHQIHDQAPAHGLRYLRVASAWGR